MAISSENAGILGFAITDVILRGTPSNLEIMSQTPSAGVWRTEGPRMYIDIGTVAAEETCITLNLQSVSVIPSFLCSSQSSLSTLVELEIQLI